MRHFDQVLLAATFELATQQAITDGHCALVAAGYAQRDAHGTVSDLWVDLHFRYEGRASLLRAWVARTKPMCLATPADVEVPRTIALHPATAVFADRFAPSAQRQYVEAKPLAVRRVADGRAEACIGSVDVAVQAGLVVRKRWQPTMVWCLYEPAKADALTWGLDRPHRAEGRVVA
ncbi:hypothetical protein [Kitasatospora sp. LaBMicrA B282]|uniref:hypothetical protein n=1 Tax=Kitasatospora sp. LaBMicrA B282 TaxID=3420949 RepID=UPI003D0B6C30